MRVLLGLLIFFGKFCGEVVAVLRQGFGTLGHSHSRVFESQDRLSVWDLSVCGLG